MSQTNPSAPSVFLPVFRRIGDRLHHMASALLGNDMEADDALQDAFCRLWPQSGDIGSERDAEALLTTTVRRLSIDALRRRETARTNLEDTARLADEEDDAEAAEEREERFRTVEALIERELTPSAREILHRREYDGEDLERIAADMGMQPAAVRMTLSRARKTIRNCYLKLSEQ